MKHLKNITFISLAFLLMLSGCDKNEPYEIIRPPALAHFIAPGPYVNYYVRNAASDSFVIQVGTSDISSVDRSVSFNISSTSGAASGQEYSVINPPTGNSILIKAGSAIGSLTIKGKFTEYNAGQKDTLVVTLTEPSVPIAKFNDTLRIILQGYCDVNLDDLIGLYENAFDTQAGSPNYGPYTLEVMSASSTGATTGYIMVSNFWDVGGADIRINLDWTDPANFTTTVPSQFLYRDGTYGPATITGVGTGSFSSCDNTFRISYQVTVAAGSFGNFITRIAR